MEISCSRVYDDEDFFAILDIRPVNLGHVLLIPRKHYENIFDIPEELSAKIYPAAQKIAAALKKSINCDGVNLVQNNGEAAGQEVFHAHLHLIPRFKNDGIRIGAEHKSYAGEEDMCNCGKRIADALIR